MLHWNLLISCFYPTPSFSIPLLILKPFYLFFERRRHLIQPEHPRKENVIHPTYTKRLYHPSCGCTSSTPYLFWRICFHNLRNYLFSINIWAHCITLQLLPCLIDFAFQISIIRIFHLSAFHPSTYWK